MTLQELSDGQTGVIVKVRGRGAFRKRITEMGFVKGKLVKVIKSAPLRDPVEYDIMGYRISLRKSEAELIEIISEEEAAKACYVTVFNGVVTEDFLKTSAKVKSKTIDIALVGNPNCGKTTIFNKASNSKEHVGNYSGVTVDAKTATFKQDGYIFNITDLPGTYSLSAYTIEEKYVREYILENNPDIVVNVLDASNLERNLYLTTQLIDMDIRVVIALNMYDELEETGDKFDYKLLGDMLGIPIIPTVGSKGRGIEELFAKIIDVYEERDPIVRHIHIKYGEETDLAIRKVQGIIWTDKSLTDRISSRFIAIKMLEKDELIKKYLSSNVNITDLNKTVKKEIELLEYTFSEDTETLFTDAKYGFIAGALLETYKQKHVKPKKSLSEKIDSVLTHRFYSFPIFLFFLWLMFVATFFVGRYPMMGIQYLVNMLGATLAKVLPQGIIQDMLVNGIINGVGGVLVFLPNILILFLFISIMEDTGYMARAAFITDSLMHKMGLHGKSFISLIMGFGCNVPAIMSTRTLENRNDRLLTMLIMPFMSCSARLPVYILMISAFFPDKPGTILFGVYLTGSVMAVLVAILFKKTMFKSKDVPFVMELPPYRIPTAPVLFRHVWFKGSSYLKKMGGIILLASLIIWGLGYFPRETLKTPTYKMKIASMEANKDLKLDVRSEMVNEIKQSEINDQFENSYIGKLGRFIEPAIRPLGFDWRMGVSLITGAVSKEVVVSTMSVLYQADNKEEKQTQSLVRKLQIQTYDTGTKIGEKVFTPVVALSFILFVLLYSPCIGVITAINKESGKWKWAVFTAGYTTALAWVIAFAVSFIHLG